MKSRRSKPPTSVYPRIHLPSLRRALNPQGHDKLPLYMDQEGVILTRYNDACEPGVDSPWSNVRRQYRWLKYRVVKAPDKGEPPPEPQHGIFHSPHRPHRLFLQCEYCGEWVPAGRLNQHGRKANHQEGKSHSTRQSNWCVTNIEQPSEPVPDDSLV